MMQTNKLIKIRYAKTITEDESQFVAEKTERTIVPISVPGNIKAIDVTDLAVDEQHQLCVLYEEYAEYFNDYSKQAFSFEDWALHSKNVFVAPKWRTFKPDQTEEIA